ncbi:MAG: hypothetical protein SFV51_09280, partial [Bryobacteraceae bacterium]|nr:hypothetical protein [Bryobacteraceae bacterium]
RPARLFGANQNPPVVANGVIVFLDQDGPNVALDVTTAQGNFEVRLADIPYGTVKPALDGRAMVDRVPPYARLNSDEDEQDYPAVAAAADGSVWIAYLEFQHHPDHHKLRANFSEAPASFEALKSAPKGDRVMVRRYENGVWGEPVAVTPGGGDLYRPAVAVDGGGRVWVFWSANEGGDFELIAAAVRDGRVGPPLRLTRAAGSDVFPAAATDSTGRVWVAWQAWRNGRAGILAAAQNGDGFGEPTVVSASAGNDWNPAVAADRTGRLTVTWDSYRNGNYDIFARTVTGGAWGKEFAVAGSLRYEAYATAAYDPQGRLWVAYEEGAQNWGKDFGAHDTSGIALYQGRAIRVRGFEKNGRALELPAVPDEVLPGTASLRVDLNSRQSGDAEWLAPQPERAAKRPANRASQNFQAPKNTMPRIHVDASGRLWLAARSNHPVWWSPIGTAWTEYVASFDGKSWTGPVFLTHSDNLLDNRPALVSLKPGQLMVIGSSDHRRQFHLPRRGDPYSNDLFVNTLEMAPAAAPWRAKEIASPALAAMDAGDKAEAGMVKGFRAARIRSRAGELRVLRGEFHRHSEVSADGGNDGSILDQWRYILDAAAMEWAGCCDHDNGGGREYSWWTAQKLTDIFHAPGQFVPMFSYERSVRYPEGHRNVVFAERGIRTLPRLPITGESPVVRAPDTQMLYRYLRHFNGIVAMHTSGTNMGTDWRDNDPLTEPVVEIYQGDRQNYEMPGAPRGNSAADSIGGWRPKGFVNLALEMGYKLAFQASSDHISTHQSYCNVLVKDFTRKGVLDAFQKRHVYGATENILADFRSGDHIMGDEFRTTKAPEFRVKLTGTAPFAKVVVVKDNKYVYTSEPRSASVEFRWRDNESARGKTSYYYVRGEQSDGEVVWVSPMWVTRD